jgi:hypothetical protein
MSTWSRWYLIFIAPLPSRVAPVTLHGYTFLAMSAFAASYVRYGSKAQVRCAVTNGC